jgi:hypothetical protein
MTTRFLAATGAALNDIIVASVLPVPVKSTLSLPTAR